MSETDRMLMSSNKDIELEEMDNEEEEEEDDPAEDVELQNGDIESGRASGTPSKRRENPLLEVTTPAKSPTPSHGLWAKTLHQMARDGDADSLKLLFDNDDKGDLRKHINDLDEKKLTPLHYAARHANLTVMKILVENGAVVNKKGDDDMTPLHYVSRYGRLVIPREKRRLSASPLYSPSPNASDGGGGSDAEDGGPKEEILSLLKIVQAAEQGVDCVVEYLVQQGADVNANDKYGMTPLHHAAIRGNKQAMHRLLSSPGIEKEPQDVQKSTPLHLAATYDQPAVVRLLLKQGANPRSLDDDQRTPLHEACQEGNTKVVEILLEESEKRFDPGFVKAMLQDTDDDGATPLLLGVGSGGSDIVKLLLDHKANPNIPSKENLFPVHSAARTGDLETLQILAENGARINTQNSLIQTPLYLAAENNNVEVITYLIDMDANVNTCSVTGVTPLIVAAMEGNAESVQTLIERNASVDICDRDDRSALFHAASGNNTTVIEQLLSYPSGRDLLEVADMYDNLPIHVGAEKGNLEGLVLLLDANSPYDRKNEDEQTPIHLAAIHGRVDVIETLLKLDRNAIMSEDENSNTPLHLACMHKKSKTADKLLKYGADVQCRNAKKWTALDCAAAAGAYKCAQLLLECNAPIDPTDRNKTTPLHLAAENGHAKLITLLLDHGANISMEDSQCRNALERAILSDRKNCVKTILEHKDWRKALRTSYPTYDSHGALVPETPTRLLVKRYPDLAEMVFDHCVTVEDLSSRDPGVHISKGKADKIVHMNYEFIDDAFFLQAPPKEADDKQFKYCLVDDHGESSPFRKRYNNNSKIIMDNHPLMVMAEEKQRNLLRHPLCLALVRKKWIKYGRYLYYSSLFIYGVFLTLLTSYTLLAPNPVTDANMFDETCKANNDNNNNETVETDKQSFTNYSKRDFQVFCQYGVMALVALNCLLELIQFYRSGRRYIQWTNLFDWVVYVLSFLLVLDIQSGSTSTGIRTCWQWELIAITVTLAWLNLLGDIRQLPYLGIYVIMFFDILKTFLRFGIVFLVFIVAFGLGFHLLLINQTPFNHVGGSLLKTSVMMIGEFEYENIFFGDNPPEFSNMTYAFFVAFLVVMSIIIVNLLIGLAVDDIKAVQEQAILKRLAMQVELVLDVERLLPVFILRKLSGHKDVIRPKQQLWWSVFTDVVSSRSIIQDVDDLGVENTSNLAMAETMEALNDNVKGLRAELRTVTAENEAIRKLLAAIADKNNIYLDDQDSGL